MDIDKEESAATKLQIELQGVIYRFGQESDITVYEVLGALEIIKDKYVCALKEAHNQES